MTCNLVAFTLEMARGYPLSVNFNLTDNVGDPFSTIGLDEVGFEIRKRPPPNGIPTDLVMHFDSNLNPTVVIPTAEGFDIEINSALSLTFPDEVAVYNMEAYAIISGERESLGTGRFNLCKATARRWEA